MSGKCRATFENVLLIDYFCLAKSFKIKYGINKIQIKKYRRQKCFN